MSLWDKIRDKILPPRKDKPTIDDLRADGTLDTPGTTTFQPADGGVATAPTPTTGVVVDVEQVLEAKMAEKGNPDLNWRTSIVDLMKLLDIDSSLDNRKELARELGYTGQLDGSAEMNIWLHKATMKQLAANGGKIPTSMID